MKTKKLTKKLGLNKETIATLDPDVISIEEKNRLKGGKSCTWCSVEYSCDTWCAPCYSFYCSGNPSCP